MTEEYFNPNYEYWKKFNCWTIHEAVCLLVSLDPVKYEDVLEVYHSQNVTNWEYPDMAEPKDTTYGRTALNKYEEYNRIRLLSLRSYNSGDELLTSVLTDENGPHWEPRLFLAWAKKRKIDVPEELRDMINFKDLFNWNTVDVKDFEGILGKPNYNHWKSLIYWTLKEAVYLVIDVDPNVDFLKIKTTDAPLVWLQEVDFENNDFLHDIKQKYRRIYEIALRDLEEGHIGNNTDTKKINPFDFVKWAKEKNLKIPKPLCLLDLEQPKEAAMPLMKEEDPYYSFELDLAMSAWKALYVNGELNPKRSHKQQIENWLKKKYKGLTQGQLKRIAIVVNPNKKGGAPSIN